MFVVAWGLDVSRCRRELVRVCGVLLCSCVVRLVNRGLKMIGDKLILQQTESIR